MRFLRAHRQFAIYLTVLSLLGMLMAYLVTHRYGPGLSTDGARYLSTAQNLTAGKGFYDYLGLPLTQFPPLYSILIAGLSLLTGMDIFVAAQALNILTFGLVIWLSGYFFLRIFPSQRLIPYFGSAIFATSLSLLLMASNVLSDLLFLAFTLAFLIAATDMLDKGTSVSILILGGIACLAAFQRYAGLVLIMTGAVLILFLYRKNLLRGILTAGIFSVLSALPILLWVWFHNYLRTGILFGVRMPPNYLGNLQVTIEKAVHWFVPVTVTSLVPIWVILLIGLVILVSGSRPADWKRWLSCLTTPGFLPSLIFFFFYLAVLIFNISYREVRWPFMDRIHIIILPALLALSFLTVRELAPAFVRKLSPRTLQILSVAAFVLWLSFPVYNIQKYLSKAFTEGETSEYNLYNIPALRELKESGIQKHLDLQSMGTEQKVYSNYEAAAWFLTRRPISKIPFGDVETRKVDPGEVLRNFPDWPGEDGAGVVLWIKALEFKPYVLQPVQLGERAALSRST